MPEISQEARDAALLLDRPHGRDRGERTIQDVIDKRDAEWQKTLDYSLEDQGRLEWVIDNHVLFEIGCGKLSMYMRHENGGLSVILRRDDHDYRAALDDARKKGV